MENESVVQNVEIEPQVEEVISDAQKLLSQKGEVEVKTLIEGPKAEPEKPMTLEESMKVINTLTARIQLAEFVLGKLFNKLSNGSVITQLDTEAEVLAKLLGTSFRNKVVRSAPVKTKKPKND